MMSTIAEFAVTIRVIAAQAKSGQPHFARAANLMLVAIDNFQLLLYNTLVTARQSVVRFRRSSLPPPVPSPIRPRFF